MAERKFVVVIEYVYLASPRLYKHDRHKNVSLIVYMAYPIFMSI